MRKLFLTFLLFVGISFSQGIDTQILYLIENYDFSEIDIDTSSVQQINITDDTDTYYLRVADDTLGIYNDNDTRIAYFDSSATMVVLFDLKVLGGNITGANGNAIDIGEVADGTVTFSRDDSGTIILTTADNDANADFTIVPGGTGNLLLGDSGGTVQIVSSDWAISTTGHMTGIGKVVTDSTMSIGGWGYTGEHFTIPETSDNTNAGLGVYSVVDYSVTAGKVFAGTYNRILAMTTNQTNQSTMVGSESQFRLRDVDIADGVHAGIWVYAEQSGTSTLSGGGTFDAISATVESESGFTVGATEQITGGTFDSSINASASIDASANFSALYVKSNGKDWYHGLKVTGSAIGAEISGTTIGIDMQGAYSNAAIDLTDVTNNYGGSSGPVLIRGGTYGSPMTSADAGQSGGIRLYTMSTATTDDESTGYYDRGIFIYNRTDGSKGIYPIAGLAEVRTVSGDGPTEVMAGQFIADLHTTGAKLANSTGVQGMYGGWFKITAIDGATTGATSKKAAIWLDNQMHGNNAAPGEEFTIHSTTGGNVPDAWAEFETSGAGWDQLLYFDETAYNVAPVSDLSLKVLLNTTQYYLPLSTTAPGYTFSSDLTLGGNLILGGTVDGKDIATLLGATPGTATASIALIVDASKDITLGTGDLTATNLTGTLQTAAQTNITSVGTLTSLSVSGDIVTTDDTKDIGSLGTPFNLVYADSIHANWFGGSDFELGESGYDITIDADSIKGEPVWLGNLMVTGNLTVTGSQEPYAEMYLNANGNPTTIETANTPIAVKEFTTGTLNGWTFDAGSTGAITAFYDRGANVGVHDDGHGLATGDIISIRGTTDYNGVFSVTVVDADSFYIAETWNNDNGASDWDEPSYLLAGASAAGTYVTNYNISTSEGGGAGSTVNYCLYIDASPQNKTIMQRKFANNDVGAIPGGGEVTIVAEERLFLTQQSNGTNALTNSYGNIRIEKL